MKLMKAFAVLVALSTGLSVAMLSSAAKGGDRDSSASGETMPNGYRDWTLISVAHEEGKLNDIRAILGNAIAVKAYREGTIPFPDGAIIARLAWQYLPSDDNNKAFGHPQSFVAGPPTNVQFLQKNSKQFASTGGWEFVQFNEGKPVHIDAKACFSCHIPVKDRDFVFTRYSP